MAKRTGLEFPKTRAAAENTPFEAMWQTPDHWPRNVRMLSIDDQEAMGVDPNTGAFYWDGKIVALDRKISLEGPTFWVALVATAATVVSALWPIVDYLWLP